GEGARLDPGDVRQLHLVGEPTRLRQLGPAHVYADDLTRRSNQLREINRDLPHSTAHICHPHSRLQPSESQKTARSRAVGSMQNTKAVCSGLSGAEHIAIKFGGDLVYRHDNLQHRIDGDLAMTGEGCCSVVSGWIGQETHAAVSLRPTNAHLFVELPKTGTY